MNTANAFPDPEEVLDHLDWVRGLAVSLVGDPSEADDLCQEVWLLSRRLGKPGRGSLRGWLGGILKNVVRDRRRAARTRSLHEESSALERTLSVHEPVAVRQASMHQVVVERLMGLREPYRATLLAQYFEGMGHAEIAERDGVAIATVRSRLQRGLAELRTDMNEEQHSHGSLLALLALHTWEPEVLAVHAAGTSASSVWAWGPWLFAGLVAVGIAVVAAWPDSNALVPDASPLGEPAVEVAVLDPAPQDSGGDPRREIAALSKVETLPLEPAPEPASGTALIEAIDLQGRPLAGEKFSFLRFLPDGTKVPGPQSTTGEDGRATISGVAGLGMVYSPETDLVQLGLPVANVESAPGHAAVVVMCNATMLAGRIRTPEGDPLAGVRVRLSFMAPFPGAIQRHMDHSNHANFRALTDAEGRFRLKVPQCSIPMGLSYKLVGHDDGLESDLLFDQESDPIELTMSAIQDPDVGYGKVLSDAGEALEGAWVGDGTQVVRTMAGGEFQMGPVAEGVDLWVGAAGYLPQRVPRVDDLRGIELVLVPGTLAIEGRVTLPDGSGAEGLTIRLWNEQPAGTHFYMYGGRRAFIAMAVEAFGSTPRGPLPGRAIATTASDGSFRLAGLLPRDYDLEVSEPAGLQRLEPLRFPAGAANVSIAFPAPADPVNGTIHTPEGEPLTGILVRSLAAGDVFRQGAQVRSDADGEFRFDRLVTGTRVLADVPLPWVHLGAVLGDERSLDLEIEPAARVSLKLDLSGEFAGGQRLPETIAFRGASGAPVRFVVDDILYYRVKEVAIRMTDDGASDVSPMIVPTRAHELVLSDASGPILVLPLDLEPGQEVQLAE